MINLILDSSIILSNPKVLGLKVDNTQLLVTLDVFHEIQTLANQRKEFPKDIIHLIERAAQDGFIELINTNQPGYLKYKSEISLPRMGLGDVSILLLAHKLRESHEEVHIVTRDRQLSEIASRINIDSYNDVDIEKLLTNFYSRNKANNSIEVEITSFQRKQSLNLLKGFLLGVFGTICAFILYRYFPILISTIKIWGVLILIFIIGMLLFIFRERQRMGYGILEVLVGFGSVILLLMQKEFDYSKMSSDLDLYVKILGGLYIMVRGWDNIIKYLKDKPLGVWLRQSYGIGAYFSETDPLVSDQADHLIGCRAW